VSAPIDRESASRIRLVVLDADGVLTDGGIYVADGVDGEPFQLRRFHVRDGVGLHLLRRAGVEPVVVSGRSSPAVRARAAELGIEEVRQVSPWEKVGVVGGMLERRGLAWTEAACLADDLPEVRARAAWCGELPGGAGAVREFVEALLRARGAWDGQVEAYVRRARGEGGAGGST